MLWSGGIGDGIEQRANALQQAFQAVGFIEYGGDSDHEGNARGRSVHGEQENGDIRETFPEEAGGLDA